jgi:hypothetical protein
MEEIQIEEIKKESFLKKKLWGFPVIALIICGIILVVFLLVYYGHPKEVINQPNQPNLDVIVFNATNFTTNITEAFNFGSIVIPQAKMNLSGPFKGETIDIGDSVEVSIVRMQTNFTIDITDSFGVGDNSS